MARCSRTGLEGGRVSPPPSDSQYQPPLLSLLTISIAINHYCHFFVPSSQTCFLNFKGCFFVMCCMVHFSEFLERMPIFWRLCRHYAFQSHKRKACSVWVSPRVMRIPLYAKKCEARSSLVWAQVRAGNTKLEVLTSARHRKGGG